MLRPQRKRYGLALQRRSSPVLLAVSITVTVAALAASVFVLQHKTPPPISINTATAVQPIEAEPEGISSHMLFVGDVFWGRTVQTKAQRSGLGHAYLTHGLTKADRQAYDAWIGNFECPITTTDIPLNLQIDNLKFNCRPEYLPNLANWFTAASQANNHTDNNGGLRGLTHTRQNLETNGIQHFGSYDMNKTDDICEVISMPATTTQDRKVRIPVALCGFMYVTDATPTDTQLQVMREYATVMPVIAFPHMGVEYRPTAEAAKVAAYRRMIDAGADVVIGAHPHVIQNSEAYKGRLIAYSTGNFLFDQQSLGRATTLGLGVGIRLSIVDASAAKIYEKVGSDCSVYKDNCLAELTSQLSSRPNIKVGYDFTCFDESGGVPVRSSKPVCDQTKRTATIDKLTSLSSSW